MKKQNKEILLLITILIFVSSCIISRPIGDMDEIWNYNFANSFANGLVPYKDYNTIVTPLLQIITGIILKVAPNELITMRIIAIVLISAIIYLIYKILDLLKVNDCIKVFSVIGIMLLECQYFCIDYNFFALFLTLIIMYVEIKHLQESKIDDKEYKYNLLIGVLAGMVCLTKQTIGVMVSSAIVFYKILPLIMDKIKNKQDIKYKFYNVIFRIIGILIPICIFIVYLICTKSFNDFIDYAIFGIKTFSNKIDYKNLFINPNIFIRILSILVPISFIINFGISIKLKNKKIFIINCLSIAMFIVAFPISDDIHFLIGATAAFINIVYSISIILERIKIKKDIVMFFKFFIESIAVCWIFFIFIKGIHTNYMKIEKVEYYSKLSHYKYIPISKDYENEIKMVEKYIENSSKKVYILNFDAGLYMIPINRYNKDYDLFLKGNIGSKGEQGQIEKIKTEDAKYLIVKDGIGRNWQNPENVRKYIKSNMKYTESISNFDVYENY